MEKSFSRYDYSVTLPVLSLEEILAAKIVALLNRYTPRDLYDIYQTSFLKPTLNETLLRYLVLYYGLISRTSIFELFQPQWENVSEYDIRRLLHPLLIRGHYPEREEMIETANIFLQPLLTLTNDEKAVFDRFYRTGELQIEGLFTGEELQENIAQSPAFKWKKGNVMMTAKEERQK